MQFHDNQRMYSSKLITIIIIAMLLLTGCAESIAQTSSTFSPTQEVATLAEETQEETLTITVSPTKSNTPTSTIPTSLSPTVILSPTPDTRPDAAHWVEWPIVPAVSEAGKKIYESGIQMGNDPHVFSVIGDCQSEPTVFLGIYETDRFWLDDDHDYLRDTIAYYTGSFSRKSLSVRDGLSAPSALSPLWADHDACLTNENPVECELRVRKPSIMFINLGTNWKAGASAEKYEEYLHQIVQLVIDNGTLPILSTKADNVEGDHSLNRATAQVAYDFDIPLYNFWRAAYALPNHGLDATRDNIYLTTDCWNTRNFYGLMTLDGVRKAVAP
jgi:hypothetical protein